MPMLTVYTADPALRFKCNECRSYILVPNAIDMFPVKMHVPMRGRQYGGWVRVDASPYSRLEYYSLRGGLSWGIKGINVNSHYMTEMQLGVCYFKNSV